MTPGAGVLMLGRGHISHYSEDVLYSILYISIFSTLIAIVLRDYDAAFQYHHWFLFYLWWGCWYTNMSSSDEKSVYSLWYSGDRWGLWASCLKIETWLNICILFYFRVWFFVYFQNGSKAVSLDSFGMVERKGNSTFYSGFETLCKHVELNNSAINPVRICTEREMIYDDIFVDVVNVRIIMSVNRSV